MNAVALKDEENHSGLEFLKELLTGIPRPVG